MKESTDYIITKKELFYFGTTKFIKNIEHILSEFDQEEQIDILDTFILITNSFLQKKEYSECADIYEKQFLRKYRTRCLEASQVNIFDYFSFEGLKLNYTLYYSAKDGSISTIDETGLVDEAELNKYFDGILTKYLYLLKNLLHILLVYTINTKAEKSNDVSNSKNGTVTISNDQSIQKINIKQEHQEKIYTLLSNSFSEKDLVLLKELLKGNSITENTKLVYEGNVNRFTDIFWLLSDPKVQIINNDKTFLMEWINKFFSYKKGSEYKDFTLGTLKKYIHSQSRVCQKPFPGLEQIR